MWQAVGTAGAPPGKFCASDAAISLPMHSAKRPSPGVMLAHSFLASATQLPGQNPEPRTQNPEHRTQNTEHRRGEGRGALRAPQPHRTQNRENRWGCAVQCVWGGSGGWQGQVACRWGHHNAVQDVVSNWVRAPVPAWCEALLRMRRCAFTPTCCPPAMTARWPMFSPYSPLPHPAAPSCTCRCSCATRCPSATTAPWPTCRRCRCRPAATWSPSSTQMKLMVGGPELKALLAAGVLQALQLP